jgi:hypothetical protein
MPTLGCCNSYLDLTFLLLMVGWRPCLVTWEEMRLLKVCNHDGWTWRMMQTLHN